MTSNADITRRFRIVGQDEGAAEVHDQRSTVTLRSLQLMSVADLRRCYERAESPTDIVGLDGLTRGTLLTLVGPLSQGTARVLTNRVAGSARFPWIGKSFQSWAEDRGSGINRLRVLGERLWLHFETRVDRSQLDGRPCIVLDYDHAENPWPVRLVRDELREVAPGLWLGPATVRGHVALFFALESP